jgi:hypothetical protein
MVVLAIVNSLYLHRQNGIRAKARQNGDGIESHLQGDKSIHFKYIT